MYVQKYRKANTHTCRYAHINIYLNDIECIPIDIIFILIGIVILNNNLYILKLI